MTGESSPLAAVLTVVSVVSLSLLSLLCLRCKKKSKIIQAESQIYDQQIFQRGGSKFVVMRSKTVTRNNQTSSATAATFERSGFEDDQTEEQADYQNVTVPEVSSSLEHDYVAPIDVFLYENDKNRTPEVEQTAGVYGNVFPSLSMTEDDDYENAAFLEEQMDDEPDYVNENGDCT